MRSCATCGARIGETCPICDWRLAEAPAGDEVAPRQRRLILTSAATTLLTLAGIAAGAVASFVRG